jgi:putative oxidoreductase
MRTATLPGHGMPAATWADGMLSVLRMVTAFLFMMHGMAKVLHVPFQPQYANLEIFSVIGLAGLLELVGGALLLLGLFTRPVAFVLSGEMAVAYFMAHAPKAFLPLLNQGDSAVLYCFVFLYLVFSGPGRWSLDALRERSIPLGGGLSSPSERDYRTV